MATRHWFAARWSLRWRPRRLDRRAAAGIDRRRRDARRSRGRAGDDQAGRRRERAAGRRRHRAALGRAARRCRTGDGARRRRRERARADAASAPTRRCTSPPSAASAPIVEGARSRAGAVVDARTSTGATPLMLAAAPGDTQRDRARSSTRARDVNATEDDRLQTPLIFAAANNRLDAVKLLIARGADPNARDEAHRPRRAQPQRREPRRPQPRGQAEPGRRARRRSLDAGRRAPAHASTSRWRGRAG